MYQHTAIRKALQYLLQPSGANLPNVHRINKVPPTIKRAITTAGGEGFYIGHDRTGRGHLIYIEDVTTKRRQYAAEYVAPIIVREKTLADHLDEIQTENPIGK